MTLKLNRPLIFFDLETTGINITLDRIIEIGLVKIFPDKSEINKSWLLNPEMTIPEESIRIHGITNEKVKDKPTFKQLSQEIRDIFKNSDLAGFNSNRFDIPILIEEMLKADIDFNLKTIKLIDVQTIFHKKEERTLSAGYKFYCGKALKDAHSAEVDAKATYEILLAQLERYPDLSRNVNFLSEFSSYQKKADFAGFIEFNDKEEEIFSFGKYKNRKISEILLEYPNYYKWMMNADFPLYTKKILTQIKLNILNKKT